jgi:alpha-aminoadipate/glutamate carrier protein LysW
MATANCPVCSSTVTTPISVRLSEVVDCSECRSELEVITVSPVMFALAPEPEEDWGE